MMKLLLVLGLLQPSFTSILYVNVPQENNLIQKNVPHNRRYFPEEDDPYHMRYLIFERENGSFQTIDILRQPVEYTANAKDLTYYLYTKKNPDEPFVLKNSETEKLKKSNFNASKDTVFIIHGWQNNKDGMLNQLLFPRLVDIFDVNVFVVDWSIPANKNYVTAALAVPVIGKFLQSFIDSIMVTFSIPSNKFALIGHGLGAHVAGVAGKNSKTLYDQIIGLDPAAPLFTVSDKKARLASGDAKYVQVIHTNGGTLGFASSLGDSDFFPNGGSSQLQCRNDIAGFCAHNTVYIYMEQALSNNTFVATRCSSYKLYTSGGCSNNLKSLMGQYKYGKPVEGDFFLTINPDN